jgi:hypothetical protein
MSDKDEIIANLQAELQCASWLLGAIVKQLGGHYVIAGTTDPGNDAMQFIKQPDGGYVVTTHTLAPGGRA